MVNKRYNTLGYIDMTIQSNIDNGRDVTWSNREVIELLVEIRDMLR